MISSDILYTVKISDHCYFLAAKGQVDKILDLGNAFDNGGSLKLDILRIPEAFQPFCEVVQFIYIDIAGFQAF